MTPLRGQFGSDELEDSMKQGIFNEKVYIVDAYKWNYIFKR